MPDFGIMRGFNEKLFGDKLVAGQLPTQLGLIGSLDINPLLLDLYPNAAAAYSVRKLRTLYTGNAIRVRRSSDNTEQNIGFDVLGDLDNTALTTFCSGTNGFVTTWYDQSGNARNVTQTTAANQPQIVSSGSVINVNFKPSIKYQDNTDLLRNNTATGTSIFNTMAVVMKFNLTSGYGLIMSLGDTAGSCYALAGRAGTLNRIIYTVSGDSQDGLYTQNQEIWGSTTALLSAKFWFNGVSQTITRPTTTYTANLNDILIGNDNYGSSLNPNMQEAIYWATTQSDTDLVAINTNQNTYFNVY